MMTHIIINDTLSLCQVIWPLTEQSAKTYAATFDTNVLGTILSLKHELRVMLAQGHGSIVNLSSTFGSRGAAGASMYVGHLWQSGAICSRGSAETQAMQRKSTRSTRFQSDCTGPMVNLPLARVA